MSATLLNSRENAMVIQLLTAPAILVDVRTPAARRWTRRTTALERDLGAWRKGSALQ
jgi:hypothetical protein